METDVQKMLDLEREIVVFQRQEILLLQSERYDEWLELLTDDIWYWMPMVVNSRRNQSEDFKEDDFAYYDDNLDALRLRIKRFGSSMAWSEDPRSRRRYFVQILNIEPTTPDYTELDVYSNIMVYQTRGENQENHFYGGREDKLRKVDGKWKVARRKVIIDRSIIVDRFLNTFF